MVSASTTYSQLISQLAKGRALDVSGDELVTKRKGLVVWNYVYCPDDYACKTMSVIATKLKTATADEKKELKMLADAVFALHRNLANRNRSPKKSDVVAVSSKILHALSKEQKHTYQDVMKSYNEILHRSKKQAPAVSMKSLPDAKSAVKKHRKPNPKLSAQYTDSTSLTARQNAYVKELLQRPPNEWDLPKDSLEARAADAFLRDFAQRHPLRECYAMSAQELQKKLPFLQRECKSLVFECHRHSGVTIKELEKRSIRELVAMLDPSVSARTSLVNALQKHASSNVEERVAALKKSPLQAVLEKLPKSDPLRVIAEAHVKEIAARKAYRLDIGEKITAGNYNPAAIGDEIRQVLGITLDFIPPGMNSVQDVKDELRRQLDTVAKKASLTEVQVRYIRHDVFELVDLYAKAYPNKSCQQQYILARDCMRAIAYQELFDKGSFTGSDHGSKHVHHNCANADGLHETMHKKDFTDKDRFLEHLVHAYHDMGYTVGLAANNFACCKDHPFIGAKMIEENKDYFTKLLDEASYETLHDSILCHAIAMPDLTPDAVVRDGIHTNLVRAVTSISDACAVTYDRKTQEFWEQPESLLALTRLKLFLTQYPEYKSKLSNSEMIAGKEWAGLDETNPLDRLAHDIFQGTKKELFEAADRYPLSEERRTLFKQAIASQFNAFTVNVTIGQYGAVLTGVESVANEDAACGGPAYLPQFNMAPSIIYGVLSDLFGQDQAQEAFKKLVLEFGGNIEDISGEISKMAEVMKKGGKATGSKKRSGVAIFHIQSLLDVFVPVREKDKAHKKHLQQLQVSLRAVTQKVSALQKSAPIDMRTKVELLDELSSIRKGKSKKTFTACVDGLLAIPQKFTPEQGALLQGLYEKSEEVDRIIKKGTDVEFTRLLNTLSMIFLSDAEYDFMVERVETKPARQGLVTL